MNNSSLYKQLESLARMYEIDRKPLEKILGKTPNVNNIFAHRSKPVYSHLSEVAHFSTAKAGELLHVIESGELVGPSLHPHYNSLAHGCFDLQVFISIYFLFWLIGKQREWYSWFNGNDEEMILLVAFKSALEEGILKVES